ncbi:transcription elongation factor GreA [Lyticum sinuosum]|uniref:Transcription elongation factor GreA n=1 Tax=Lyticum sinuosum TaxID=1332059 RepID=A0AAE4VJX6_9RICK|nr:transcription elongation factor GreA [Lyticum sinuosum]MDZ5761301.1 Transcription elongation factor GreA [Lyticum sinuosum]
MNEFKNKSIIRFPISKSGYIKMQTELDNLISKDRHEIINAIAEARAHGDLSENAEYHAAKEKQALIENKIADLTDKLNRAEIIDLSNIEKDKIQFGATVKMIDYENNREVKYTIVSDYEADIKQGLISVYSPVSKALMGKKIGDEVEVETPKGFRYYEILSVDYI